MTSGTRGTLAEATSHFMSRSCLAWRMPERDTAQQQTESDDFDVSSALSVHLFVVRRNGSIATRKPVASWRTGMTQSRGEILQPR